MKTEGEEPLTIEREILKVNLRKGSVESLREEIVVEKRMELYINDKRYAVFLCLASQIRELAVGHLLTEGLIENLEEIKNLEVSEEKVYVYLTKEIVELLEKTRIILTACDGRAGKIPPHLWMKMRSDSTMKLKPQTIIRAAETLNSKAHIFRRTGATHASALLDEDGRVLAFSEDVGRHNTIDKVVGKAALESIDLRRVLLASTGRLTSEMVIKAAYVKIPVIVSLSAPTDKGIKIAETAGITLIGFTRGRRFNIYTHPERIEEL